MTCEFLYFRNKKYKINNQVFIPSNGIGEIWLDISNLYWYYHKSSFYNIDKETPFLKLLLDMTSVRMRYLHLVCQK